MRNEDYKVTMKEVPDDQAYMREVYPAMLAMVRMIKTIPEEKGCELINAAFNSAHDAGALCMNDFMVSLINRLIDETRDLLMDSPRAASVINGSLTALLAIISKEGFGLHGHPSYQEVAAAAENHESGQDTPIH